jgi:GTPase SAR1 family protein
MTVNIENDNLVRKILILGDGAVGKTTLTNWFITGGFSSEYRATIGVDVFSKVIPEKNIELKTTDVQEIAIKLLSWCLRGFFSVRLNSP